MQQRSLRILFVSPAADASGNRPLLHAAHLGNALQKLGVTIATFCIQSRTNIVTLFREWFLCRDKIANFNPDIIHAHYGTVTSMFAALLSSRPLIIHFRGSDLNPDPTFSFLRDRSARLLSQIAALRANRIIVVSRELRDRLVWQRKQIEIIPNGVDLDRFRPVPKNEARRLLDWPLHEKVALINEGKTPELKGLDLAHSATTRAADIIPNLRLHVLDGSTRFDDMPLYYSAADCLILASVAEGSPTVVKEALACGLPIVSVDVGDVRERLSGVDLARITERDPSAMAGALVELLNEDKRSNGRTCVESISLSMEAEKIKRIYEDMKK